MLYRHMAAAIGALALLPLLASEGRAQDAGQNMEEPWANAIAHQAFSEGWSNPFPDAIFPAATAQEEANARVALEFYDRMINAKDAGRAAELIGSGYDQHDPDYQNGSAGLAQYIADLASSSPAASVDVKRVVQDGDYVFLHSHYREDEADLGSIAGDIFRLENGRIVERWSILHPIPEDPSPENPNGVFGGADDGSRPN